MNVHWETVQGYIPPLLAASGLALVTAYILKRAAVPDKEDGVHRPNIEQTDEKKIAVNFHFTRQCNYNCGFCFHTAKTSHVESEENCKKILRSLRDAGFRKINFAGGEPFLEPKLLGALCKYAKIDCRFESVSIISNGSKCQESWFEKFSDFVDILGVSCDSFNEEINVQIGRGKGNHLKAVKNVATWCRKYKIQFKLNTVVNSFNVLEDVSSFINELSPARWKIFQVLPLNGENTGEKSLRSVEKFLISNEAFQAYVDRNLQGLRDRKIMKVESNDIMKSSYVLVDEYGRFLDSSKGGKEPTCSILDAGGVDAAWEQLLQSEGGGFDASSFFARDGDYKEGCWSSNKPVRDIEDLGR